jgi:hypothetical protein
MGGGRAGRAIAGKRDPKSNEAFEGVFHNIFVNPRADLTKPFSRADEASLNCRSFINTSTGQAIRRLVELGLKAKK